MVWGRLKEDGVIEGNIVRNNRNRKTFKMSQEDGRYSKTRYKILNVFEPFSYIELLPETGRTHQIRVHMKSIGHPIVSDIAYSGGESMVKSFHVKYSKVIKKVFKIINRVALHAQSIEFINPTTMKIEKYSSPLPDDIHNVINTLSSNE